MMRYVLLEQQPEIHTDGALGMGEIQPYRNCGDGIAADRIRSNANVQIGGSWKMGQISK